jgi:hypothetical protein
VSLRMLTNPRLPDARLTTAQQKTTSQKLPSGLYSASLQVETPRSATAHLIFVWNDRN